MSELIKMPRQNGSAEDCGPEQAVRAGGVIAERYLPSGQSKRRHTLCILLAVLGFAMVAAYFARRLRRKPVKTEEFMNQIAVYEQPPEPAQNDVAKPRAANKMTRAEKRRAARPEWKRVCRLNNLKRGHKGISLSKFVK